MGNDTAGKDWETFESERPSIITCQKINFYTIVVAYLAYTVMSSVMIWIIRERTKGTGKRSSAIKVQLVYLWLAGVLLTIKNICMLVNGDYSVSSGS